MTSDAVKIMYDEFIKGNPRMLAMVEKERQKVIIGSKIYEMREKAGLSQAQLARMIKTTQSVISRLEDADYRGHSFEMLSRIAAALHYKLVVKFIPDRKTYAHAS